MDEDSSGFKRAARLANLYQIFCRSIEEHYRTTVYFVDWENLNRAVAVCFPGVCVFEPSETYRKSFPESERSRYWSYRGRSELSSFMNFGPAIAYACGAMNLKEAHSRDFEKERKE